MDKLDLNMKEVHKELVDFLKENFKKNGFSKAVLGLSGGIDSALAAYLLRDALGKELSTEYYTIERWNPKSSEQPNPRKDYYDNSGKITKKIISFEKGEKIFINVKIKKE